MIAQTGSITLQFHPDWPHDGQTVIESLARDGVYRSQFATGISNGGLSARAGGDRWRWEHRLFDGRYDDARPDDRPVYGAWNRHADPYGGAIRFGSAHLRLHPDVVERTTFCFPDSVFEPPDVGGSDLLPHLCSLADASGSDDLDDYVEAHVHGRVVVAADVAAVVLDCAYRGSAIEEAAHALGCPVEYHPGLSVETVGLDPHFRGPEIAALARSLADVLTPDVIGDAARSARYDHQSLKRVWHHLARFGRHDGSDRFTD